MSDQPKMPTVPLRHDMGTIFVDRGIQPHVAHMVDRDDAEAYGDLFAAAPDLYAALERAENYIGKGLFDRSGPVLREIRAALAKARGQA